MFVIGASFPWGSSPSRSLRIVPVAYVSPSSRHFTDLAGRRLGKPQSLTPFPFFFPLNPPSGSASRRQPFDLAGEVTQLTMRFLQVRSEEHTSELQSLMRISYAVFCLKNKIISLTELLETCTHHKN